MHWYFAEQLQQERQREMGEAADRYRSRTASASARADAGEIVIRRSAPGDGAAMSALAALDGQQWRIGPALVAEVDGSLRAALPLDGAEPFSDPFRSSAEVLALLELRAQQLGALCRERAGLLSRLSWAHSR
jgi:hypothetical protein